MLKHSAYQRVNPLTPELTERKGGAIAEHVKSLLGVKGINTIRACMQISSEKCVIVTLQLLQQYPVMYILDFTRGFNVKASRILDQHYNTLDEPDITS